MYIHELSDWPHFTWDYKAITGLLAEVSRKQGYLLGQMQTAGLLIRDEAVLHTLTQDVLKSSEIEGESLNEKQVRSSIARRLGLVTAGMVPSSRNVDGVVDMLVDAVQSYREDLTEEKLFFWHRQLFPVPSGPLGSLRVGTWRDDATGPMQVVSGPIGRPTAHFEAPDAARLQQEMEAFLAWYNDEDAENKVLKAAIAHLWFVTIHPFDDGNGRLARAITDRMLAKAEGRDCRFYSLSTQICHDRNAYYEALEDAQEGSMDITEWLQWFLQCFLRALANVDHTLNGVFRRNRFWNAMAGVPLNERQRLVIGRLLEDFEGKLTSMKWGKLAKCSHDTANRDIKDLMDKGIMQKDPGGGRSTSYSLVEKSAPRDVE
jgi:Fic family protein